MKIALIADLHLEAPFVWAGPQAGDRWRRALRDTLVRAVSVAAEEHVDAFFLAGDIYEQDHISPDTAQFLARTMAALDPIPVLVTPGNHDYLSPESVWTQAEWTPNVKIFQRNRFEAFPLADGLTVWGVAHGAPAGTRDLLSGLRVNGTGLHIGLFHGALRSGVPAGATPPEQHFPFDAEEVAEAGLAHAFCGHYHVPRHDRLVTYPGNPNPLTFGETGERGMVIAEIRSTGVVDATWRSVAVGKMHDLDLDVTGATSSTDIDERLSGLLRGLRGAARVTVTGELSRDVDCNLQALRGTTTQLDALVIRRGDIHPAYDLDVLAQEQTVRGQFVRDVRNDSTLTEADRTAVLVTGLRALDGRQDLEVPW